MNLLEQQKEYQRVLKHMQKNLPGMVWMVVCLGDVFIGFSEN